jgi:class 3 adenylate cyclase
MFLDIEGYTRLSPEIPRAEVSAIVERYFSLFLADIRAETGDINETAGDGLMILFQEGGPEAHAAAAVRATLAIREKTRVANREAGEGHPAIAVNVGIRSGEGDVGATRLQGAAGERWTFTATGPVTNLAARLGELAAHGQLLLSPETAARVRGRFCMRSLGRRALNYPAASCGVSKPQHPKTSEQGQLDVLVMQLLIRLVLPLLFDILADDFFTAMMANGAYNIAFGPKFATP